MKIKGKLRYYTLTQHSVSHNLLHLSYASNSFDYESSISIKKQFFWCDKICVVVQIPEIEYKNT